MFTEITFFFVCNYWKIGKIEDDPRIAFQERNGLLFMLLSKYLYIGTNLGATLLIKEKSFFLREKESWLYNKTIYFLSSFFQCVPFMVFFCSITIVYYFFEIGLSNNTLEQFLWFYSVNLIGGAFFGLIIGLFTGIIVSSFSGAISIAPIIVFVFQMLAGFFVKLSSLFKVV